MTKEEAVASIKTLCNTCELFPKCVNEKPECFKAIELAISALQVQDTETRKICNTCKYNPPSKKWPCADCDMRDPADRWEPKDVPDTNVGDMISRQAAIELKSEFLNPNVNRETEEQTAIDRAYARGWNSCNTHWIDEISELPSAQPDPCEELDFVQEHKKIPVVLNIRQKEKSMPSFSQTHENDHTAVGKKAEPQWTPVSERLPEKPYGCFVTVWDTNPITMDEFENILPYFVGWDGEQWNDADGEQCPFEVIAWMPLPEPYREEGE